MASTVILMFGRFQPPTKGHQRLFQTALDLSKQVRADVALFLSNTVDDEENPLSHDEKAKIIQTRFPQLLIGPADIVTPYASLYWARDKGYTKIILLAGGARGPEFERMIARWKEKEDANAGINVDVVNLTRSGAMSETKVSGTVLRRLAQQNKYDEFKQLFLQGVPDSLVRDAFQKIQHRLGPVTEHSMFTRFADYHEQLMEAEDGFTLREVDVAPGTPDIAPDEEVISADELPNKITAQRGSLDPREAERVPSDTPDNQSQLVIHPLPRLKSELAKKLDQVRSEAI